VKGCKKEKHVIVSPLANSVNLQEDGLKKEKEEAHTDHLSGNHREEMGPVSHLPHQPNLNQHTKQPKVSN